MALSVRDIEYSTALHVCMILLWIGTGMYMYIMGLKSKKIQSLYISL
ncbi:hypothetical protein F383_09511 [Gossypium arboreum]|uniref:Uncharacterized protein n=1 Tax=Gossypium arboreum TaxID=29729 RepID=A0A0B0PTJ4_GOSAR|nr:hypothetical protein F383_09511 [Gossypium arboreum]